ncbi:hypothetical protein [Herbaspirillum hiltneri]|uniref:hypothetical protein n=1 Tax=Herbaspirillum hiltneri TaxID=341045 RepID=UPI001187570F|nr:hypothetical protein [Herbaspirillum hiltneri]
MIALQENSLKHGVICFIGVIFPQLQGLSRRDCIFDQLPLIADGKEKDLRNPAATAFPDNNIITNSATPCLTRISLSPNC